jgi:hypothetical protein
MPGGEWRVEGVVLEHLHRDDAPVFYVENTLANTLFGLLCWPAVFAAIPGAFFHPFHRGPADLYSPDFHQRRAPSSRPAWRDWTTAATSTPSSPPGKKRPASSRPSWPGTTSTASIIELALHCIPAAHLKLWFQRILQDVKDNRTGFPDLIQFWPAERRYEMIEVKGPGDRLQDNQLRWIEYCKEHGMPVTVCYLQWERRPELHRRGRALCEFTAKQGDLDLRFTPSPTALEGIAGHAVVASRRGEHTAPKSRWRATTACCTCAAAPTATTRTRT